MDLPGLPPAGAERDDNSQPEGAADRERHRKPEAPLRLHASALARAYREGPQADREDVRRALLPHVGILSRRRNRDVREWRSLQLPGAIYPRAHRASDHPRLHGGSRGTLSQDRRGADAGETRARQAAAGRNARIREIAKGPAHNCAAGPSSSLLLSGGRARLALTSEQLPRLLALVRRHRAIVVEVHAVELGERRLLHFRQSNPAVLVRI